MERNRRALSWILALALLITCTISGLALPVAAQATVSSGTVVKLEDFEGDSYWNGITKWTAKGQVTADPLDATNKVLKLTSAASAVYNGAKMSEVTKGKVYALSIDFYGGTGIKLQFNESGKKVYGATTLSVSAASAWKTATYFFVTTSSSTIDGYLMHLTAPSGTQNRLPYSRLHRPEMLSHISGGFDVTTFGGPHLTLTATKQKTSPFGLVLCFGGCSEPFRCRLYLHF